MRCRASSCRLLEPDLVSHAGSQYDEHSLRPGPSVLAGFPTEFYSNWQWWDLLNASQSVILDATPAEFRPIVQVIDNFSRNHKLGNVFEARVGKGRLLVCTIDLLSLANGVRPRGSCSPACTPTPAPIASSRRRSWTRRRWTRCLPRREEERSRKERLKDNRLEAIVKRWEGAR